MPKCESAAPSVSLLAWLPASLLIRVWNLGLAHIRTSSSVRFVPPALSSRGTSPPAFASGGPDTGFGRAPESGQPLGVPKATLIRFTETGCHDICPPVESPLAVLPHSLVLVLETQDPIAFQQLGKNDFDLGRCLYAAALWDILGLAWEKIAEHLGFSGKDSERSARRVISRGRELWSRIGAWPWWYFPPVGSIPREWRKHGGSPHVKAAFATWATGRIHSPGNFERATP
jgi:hypothetical protein